MRRSTAALRRCYSSTTTGKISPVSPRRISTSSSTSPSTLLPNRTICPSCRLRLSQTLSPPSSMRQASTSSKRSAPASSPNPTTTLPNPPPPMKESLLPRTHYDLFPQSIPSGPPPHGPFHIDVRSMRNEFLRLQASAHPDRHPGPLKARAEAMSAHINDAYKTLCSPLHRAQYLLSLRGIDVGDEAGKVDDMALLMEVMEMREEIESAESEEDLEGLKRRVEEREQRSLRVLEEAFRVDDLEGARAETVRLRYWGNVLESARGWEQGKGGGLLMH
ncbi:MAG: hypothetical protein M1834_004907 [Cirrosporium novae-zelandiae]|nr:MAG: hypothetical protein M1834_004907 [Cirrosporium novae-zelandiae]